MSRRRSLGWPITLGVVMIVLLVALTVGWVLMAVVASRFSGYWWAMLAIGTTFLLLVLVGVVLYLAISIKAIRLNQRQSNFIDSVTHELKSPIASMKLYLQTLSRRPVSRQKQSDFYRFMLEDLQRLDSLINHLLDAAQLDQLPVDDNLVEVDLAAVLRRCATTACQRHRVPLDTISLDVSPSTVTARAIDVEMLFGNLIDNAVKYAGDQPQVNIESWTNGRDLVITQISDNGPGIPAKLRRKVFGRFVRLGNELERSKTGTGLGLFIVRTLVKRLRGRIQVHGRGAVSGTVFEVELPGRPGTTTVPADVPAA